MCKHEEYHNQERWFCRGENTWLAHLHEGNYYDYIHIIIGFLIPMHIVVILFVYSLFKKWFGLYIFTVCSISLSLSNNFDNNVKQVIYNPGIILGANFSPVGYFSMFLSQKDFPFCIFLSRVSPNFDGVKKFHPKNREIIM